jgi:hypothetical protein
MFDEEVLEVAHDFGKRRSLVDICLTSELVSHLKDDIALSTCVMPVSSVQNAESWHFQVGLTKLRNSSTTTSVDARPSALSVHRIRHTGHSYDIVRYRTGMFDEREAHDDLVRIAPWNVLVTRPFDIDNEEGVHRLFRHTFFFFAQVILNRRVLVVLRGDSVRAAAAPSRTIGVDLPTRDDRQHEYEYQRQ